MSDCCDRWEKENIKLRSTLAAEKERTKKLNDEVEDLSKDRYREQIRAEAAEERARKAEVDPANEKEKL